MKRSNRLVILVGALLAVLAFVAIVVLLNQRGEPGTSGPDAVPTTATVLVAKQNINIGDLVTPALVETKTIPVEAVQPGALRDVSQLGGRAALFQLSGGTQITENLFGGTTGSIDIGGQLEPGEKAIAVQLDPVTGLNFLLRQGDHVDVVVAIDFSPEGVVGSPHLTPAGAETVRTVKTVLQNKRVLYVSATNIPPPPTTDSEGNEIPAAPAEVPSTIVVIIAGTDADAELLTFAQRTVNEVGAVTMTLRQTTDTATEETTGVILQDLFETYGIVIPVPVEELVIPEEETAQ